MKRWGIIAAVAALAVFAMAEFIQAFIESDPIGYFSRQPIRLLYVAGIAITGGLVALGYYKLPSRAQRRVRIIASGAAASTTTAAAGYFVFAFFSLSSTVSRLGGSTWTALSMFLPVLLILFAMAAFSWFAWWRLWKKGVSR